MADDDRPIRTGGLADRIEVGHLGGDRDLGELTGEGSAATPLVVVDEVGAVGKDIELRAEVLVVEVGTAVDGDDRRPGPERADEQAAAGHRDEGVGHRAS